MQYSRITIMVLVNTIFLKLNTRPVNNAGTDGRVYLGIGGREFYVDTDTDFDEDHDDFEAGSIRTYVFGEIPDFHQTPLDEFQWAPANYPKDNDPRQPYPLDTDVMDKFPVYIRFEPAGSSPDWCLDFVQVRVNPVGDATTGTEDKRYEALRTTTEADIYLWLGQHIGKYLALSPVPPGPLG
jgi:hypothetical protein